MPSFQLIPNRVLLLLFVALILPAYGFATGEFQWVMWGIFIGSVLFVLKWRWWWDPLREHFATHRRGKDTE